VLRASWPARSPLEEELRKRAGREVEIHGRWLLEEARRLQVETVEDLTPPGSAVDTSEGVR